MIDLKAVLPGTILCLLLVIPSITLAGFFDKAELPSTLVADVYVDVRTGPGRGYPVFYSVEQGTSLTLEAARTDWIKVTTITSRPVSGWVHRDILFPVIDDEEPALARWSWLVSAGDFSGASAISTALGFNVTRNLAVSFEAKQLLGRFSDGSLLSINLKHEPFPYWKLSPYFELGTGILKTSPHSTLARSADRSDKVLKVGVGLNYQLTRRFQLSAAFAQHNILTSRDENEEQSEWKIGINVKL